MIFSELSLIEKETGLTYDAETAILSGVKNGVPVAVFDNNKKHRFDIVCGAVLSDRNLGRIYTMAERFPKKTLLGVENRDGCVYIYCKDYNLMQENLPLLIAFLEKLTTYAKSEMRSATTIEISEVLELEDYAIITKKTTKTAPAKRSSNARDYDIKDTVKGVMGGLIGLILGCSIFVVFIMLSDLVGWIGGIVMSAAVISMYTVFSHKLKTIDCIFTAVLTFAGWLLSNGFAYLFQIFLKEQEAGVQVNIFRIIDRLSQYSMQYADLTGSMINRLIVTVVFVVAGAIGSYLFYYKHHGKDMY